MANFVTDADLAGAAFRLSRSMLLMLDRSGIGPDIIGLPDQEDVEVFRRAFEVDAELYMSMDPTRLTEEYDEIRTAANANGPSADPTGIADSAKIDLEAMWHGAAADAFRERLLKVQQRIATQREYTLVAAQAVGMMYAVNVRFRASCADLMHQTAAVCWDIAEKNAPKQTNWAKVIVDLVGKLIDVVKSPKDIAGMAIDEVLGGVEKATDSKPVEGGDALQIVNGYVEARDQLFTSYEDSLGQIQDWIAARRTEFTGLDDTLPEPLPSYADVDSPDFRYENFFYNDHKPADYAAEVERERQQYLDEKTKPGGIIAQRLAGNR